MPSRDGSRSTKAKELLSAAGQNFDSLKAAAATKDFKPVALNAKATFDVKIDARKIQSHNVVAKLEGTDKKDEYVVYTAHWDHLGKDTTLKGDQIYNGALDNASGTASLLEIAKAYTKLPPPPRRSILFLSVTAEEKGLVGAKYYATHPLYPLNKTVANINMDGINQWGKTSDFTVIGLGNSTLDDVLTDVLKAQTIARCARTPSRRRASTTAPTISSLRSRACRRCDSTPASNYIGKADGYGMKKRDEYTDNDYHKPSDEVKPDWDLSGGVRGRAARCSRSAIIVAQATALPQWKPGTEFKAKRDSMMGAKTDAPKGVELKKP